MPFGARAHASRSDLGVRVMPRPRSARWGYTHGRARRVSWGACSARICASRSVRDLLVEARVGLGVWVVLSVGELELVAVRINQEGPVAQREPGIDRTGSQAAVGVSLLAQSVDFCSISAADADVSHACECVGDFAVLNECDHEVAAPALISDASRLCSTRGIFETIDDLQTGPSLVEGETAVDIAHRQRDVTETNLRCHAQLLLLFCKAT